MVDDPRDAWYVLSEQVPAVDTFGVVAGKSQTRTHMMTVVLDRCEGNVLGRCHSH